MILAAIALGAALGATGFAAYALKRSQKLVTALEKEQTARAQIEGTVVSLLDNEGSFQGQLQLPGVSVRVENAEKALVNLDGEIETVRKKLKDTLAEKQELEKTLAEVVDPKGEVLLQLRLPGDPVFPNKTPCGDMCRFAWPQEFQESIITGNPHHRDPKREFTGKLVKEWFCKAGQDRPCDEVRKNFVDAQGQCAMYEKDDDV